MLKWGGWDCEMELMGVNAHFCDSFILFFNAHVTFFSISIHLYVYRIVMLNYPIFYAVILLPSFPFFFFLFVSIAFTLSLSLARLNFFLFIITCSHLWNHWTNKIYKKWMRTRESERVSEALLWATKRKRSEFSIT